MAEPKSLFLRSPNDVKAGLALVKSDSFERFVTFARAEFSTRNPTAEQGRGVDMFISIMRNLPEDEPSTTTWDAIMSGNRLEHSLEIPIRHADMPKEKLNLNT